MVMVMLNDGDGDDGDGDDGDGDHGDDGEDYVGRPEWRWRGRQVRWGQHTVLHNILVMVMIHGGDSDSDHVIVVTCVIMRFFWNSPWQSTQRLRHQFTVEHKFQRAEIGAKNI